MFTLTPVLALSFIAYRFEFKTKAPMTWLLYELKWWSWRHLGDASQVVELECRGSWSGKWRWRQTFQMSVWKSEEKLFWKHQPQGHYLNHILQEGNVVSDNHKKKSGLLLVKDIDFRKKIGLHENSLNKSSVGNILVTEPLGDFTIQHKVQVNVSVAQHLVN